MLGWWERTADQRRQDWESRKVPGNLNVKAGDTPEGEIVRKLFTHEVYGFTPIDRPDSLRAKRSDLGDRQLLIDATFSGGGGTGGFSLWTRLPNATGPVPAFLLLSHRSSCAEDIGIHEPEFCPSARLVARGFGVVVLRLQDIDEDFDDEHRGGVHGVFGRPKGDASWGTIAAWAWGASRALDVVADIVPEIDANRVAVFGHSRGGKTALWAAATDSRFAMAVSNNSGCAGAALARGTKGETVGQINVGFPHWFATNYRRYGEDPSKLPIDQHQLLGLIAPRLLYVASATEDAWADPEGEWLSTLAAGPAWGNAGQTIGWDAKLTPDQPIHGGRVGYHLKAGRHSLTRKDWNFFADFASKRL